MTVVVTGASGHLGANLVRELLERGRRVRVLVRSETSPALRGLVVESVLGDVRDPQSLRRAFDEAEVVYHLAALISIDGDRRGEVWDTNVTGAGNAARAALECRVRRFIHFCSIHAFDMRAPSLIDETRPRVGPGGFAYDRSKAAGEAEVRRVVDQGLDAVILHPTGVIGPHDYKPSRMGSFFLRLRHRALPALVAGGFDWVDARDVVLGAIAAEQKGRTNESYILSGAWHTMRDLAERARRLAGVRPPRLDSPMGLARLAAPLVAAVSRIRGVDPLFTPESLGALRASPLICNDKARGELSWSPRPIDESIEAVYAFFGGRGR